MEDGWQRRLRLVAVVMLILTAAGLAAEEAGRRRHAYAAMMYMGTPRDYEFYVATRVMMRSLALLRVEADLVVIASVDVPVRWVRTLKEDGVRVVSVENLKNPYENQNNFNSRFKLTLNKLYAWSLVDYDRVIMLDSDNLFLQSTDELFQCGQFCAVFINPCIFHTGLFVLQPSMVVFKDMLHELEIGRQNPDGADQGFLASYFPDLLDRPMFHPPTNGTKLNGFYRLPLGYQMDASYYYLKLRWSIPCGPNSVITFPSAPMMKPWYWWSWPALPLGLSWHEQRHKTLGYGSELPVILIQSAMYLAIMLVGRLARPSLSKLCYNRRPEKSLAFIHSFLKVFGIWSIIGAYTVPFFLIPRTVHPLLGWSLYLLASASLSSIVINAFLLPPFAVLTPWLGILGALAAMACPWYPDGVVRALAVAAYAFFCSPFLWAASVKVMGSLQILLEREAFFPPPLLRPQPPRKIPVLPELSSNQRMAKKRKAAPEPEKKEPEAAPPWPKRTLLGWKDAVPEKQIESPFFRNKEKVLVTCSRRITYRYRHLMLNVVSLLPHSKKDSKIESKESKGSTLNELIELRNCSSCLFFECRKQKDLYLWMAKSPNGPSVKFLVNAIHTMEEMKLTGNHLKGSRPIITFSSNFDSQPYWKLLKEIILQIFETPKDHRKAKPFHDHVFVFSIVDDHIWFRNYQISVPHNEIDKVDRGGLEKMTLIEVGPRFCLNPIKIFGGSFGGSTLYENPFYVSPNQIRALEKKKEAGKYSKKIKAKTRRKMHEMANPLEPDEFAGLWKE